MKKSQQGKHSRPKWLCRSKSRKLKLPAAPAAYLNKCMRRSGRQVRPDFRTPASVAGIETVEAALECRFPESLRSLLLESDGVMNMMSVDGGEWFDERWLIWPIAELAERNQWLRDRCPNRSLERFVFFSSPGVDGIMFGFPATTASAADASVFAWHPDETEDRKVSAGVQPFLTGQIREGINV